MALQAGSLNTGGDSPEQQKTLDMEKLWSTATPFPKTPIEKWKKLFLIALVAKTMIRYADIQRMKEEPILMYPPEEPPPFDKVETKAQEEARAEKNRQQRGVKEQHDKEWKHWKKSSSSGLDPTAANKRAKSILFMLRAEGQRRYEQKTLAWERGLADQTSIQRHVKTKTANTSILPEVLETAKKTVGGSDETAVPEIKMEPVGAMQRPDGQSERRGNQTQNCGNQFGKSTKLQKLRKIKSFARRCRSAQQQQASGGKQHDRPKRIRYIEQDDDVDDLLDAETQVRARTNSDREEGEIVEHEQSNSDVLDIHMQEKWDDYGVLAINKKKGTPRYKIELKLNTKKFKFMTDIGRPASSIDHKTGQELTRCGATEMRDLNADEKREQYSNFNGNTVRRIKVPTTNAQCQNWTVNREKSSCGETITTNVDRLVQI